MNLVGTLKKAGKKKIVYIFLKQPASDISNRKIIFATGGVSNTYIYLTEIRAIYRI